MRIEINGNMNSETNGDNRRASMYPSMYDAANYLWVDEGFFLDSIWSRAYRIGHYHKSHSHSCTLNHDRFAIRTPESNTFCRSSWIFSITVQNWYRKGKNKILFNLNINTNVTVCVSVHWHYCVSTGLLIALQFDSWNTQQTVETASCKRAASI